MRRRRRRGNMEGRHNRRRAAENFLQRKVRAPPRFTEMFLTESDEERQPLEMDSDSDSMDECSLDEDFIPGGLARGYQQEDFTDEETSDEEWVFTPEKTTSPKKRSLTTLKSPSKSPAKKNNNTTTPKKNTTSSSRGKNQSAKRKLLEEEDNTNDGELWHGIEEEDIEPRQPTFRPERDVGPQVNRTSSYTPLDLFQLFFSTEVIDTLVRNTNVYAKKKYKGNKRVWVPVTAADMYSFISLVLYMGIVPLKSMKDYWRGSELYTLPFPASIMSGTRFKAILGCLHLNDPAVEAANELKKGTPKYDRLCKIKPLYEQISEACYTFFHPHQHISIDERMVATKGRIALKQYIKSKPTKWGFKLFVLADSECGYTVNFFVFSGRDKNPSGKGKSYDVVMRLLNIPFLGRGYKLYVDSFYTSPKLFTDLLVKNTFACGTLRPKAIGMPKEKKRDTQEKVPRGTIRWIRKNDLLFVKWFDTREVTMCSTMHKAYSNDMAKRTVKGKDGQWTAKLVPIPGCIKDYNKYMGGVDLSDALIGYYNVLQKTTKWYKKLFYHFVDIATVNAFIIHKEMCKLQRQPMLTQKQFREKLILSLAGAGSGPNRSGPVQIRLPVQHKKSASTSAPSASEPVAAGHLPAYFAEHMKNVPSRDRGTAGRRQCVLCKMKSPVFCKTCLKTLCLTTTRNCFSEWHVSNQVCS